ncbi:MAG TPA: protein translocase subunit SecF [Mycobacteriales bacterium]|nr:protein translocase subunit SecF [Mycobacteriales bacterium]HWA65997.1 protein translocase subunit SecF [Mycobacteriales bacterium]
MARNDADSLATKLYRGEVSYNFIGRRLWWYVGSGIVILVGIVSLAVQGLNPSIDFKGGAQFLGPLNGHSLSDVTDAVSSTGITPEVSETVGSGSAKQFDVQTVTLTNTQVVKIEDALSSKLGITEDQISPTTVGSNWGSQITHKAIEGLIIFLIAVIVYLSIRFEWKMALAAIIALLHDLVITAGIYSLSGLQVSPSTVIALLTILGYSLYDTVVVFDKVRENTASIAGGSRMTFSQATNLAVNQTLVRSINTSVIALLPVIGLLVIGAGFLGAGSLKDLSFALFIGLASGAYSSIFIASPLLCDFKEREATYQQLAKRVATRREREAVSAPAVATAAGPIPADVAPEVLTPADLAAAEGEAPRPRRTGAPPKAGARPAGRRRPGGGNRSRKRR